MKLEELNAILLLAGIKYSGVRQIENRYWPDHPNYDDLRQQYPWWVVTTEEGNIFIGWRKRVISIDWVMTSRRGLVTKDDVTKDNRMVHAWSFSKAVEYLRAWKSLPIVDVNNGEHKTHLIEGREQVIEVLRLHGDESLELDLVKGLLDEVKDESSVFAAVTRVGDLGHSFNIKIGNVNINLYPRGE